MTEEEIVEFLTKNIDYFDTNNLVTWILRELGWLLVKGFNIVIDVLKNLYDHTFALVDITNWDVLKNFLAEYNPLIKAIMILSLLIVGYMFLFGKDKKHDVFASFMIFIVVATSSSYLFSTFNTMSVMFKDAVTGGENVTDGYELVNQNLYDLLYIDKNGGLIQMNGSTPPPQYAENSLDKKDMKMIDITETVDYSRDGLTDEAEEILSKRLEYASDESRLIDVYNGVAWTSFGNTFYYRYQFNFGTYFLLAIASIFVLAGLAYKNIKIVYELFVGRILATLFSGDLTGKRKMVRILEAIRDGYYALCFTAITLRSFFLFSDYITGRNFGGLERGIMILILAFVVVDGANLMQQITGIDAGLSSMAGKMIAGMHMARGAMSSVRNAKQMSQLKRQTKSLEEMKNSNNSEKTSAFEDQTTQHSDDKTSQMDQQTAENTKQNSESDVERSSGFTENRNDHNSEYNQSMDESMSTEYDAENERHTETMDGSAAGDTDRRFEAMDQELSKKDQKVDSQNSKEGKMPESGQGKNEEKGIFDRWEDKMKESKLEGMQTKAGEQKPHSLQKKAEEQKPMMQGETKQKFSSKTNQSGDAKPSKPFSMERPLENGERQNKISSPSLSKSKGNEALRRGIREKSAYTQRKNSPAKTSEKFPNDKKEK